MARWNRVEPHAAEIAVPDKPRFNPMTSTLQFARRVAVYSPDCARPDYISAHQAQRQYIAGLVVISDISERSGVVSVERIAGVRAPNDAKPGSFGIHREHVPVGNQYGLSGGLVFSHKRTYERIAA